jgi:hypothetical protein
MITILSSHFCYISLLFPSVLLHDTSICFDFLQFSLHLPRDCETHIPVSTVESSAPSKA